MTRPALEPCQICGAPTPHAVVLAHGAAVVEVTVCHGCYDAAVAGAARWRAEFEALLEAGVSRAQSNATIIARMEAQWRGTEVAS